MTGMLSAVTPEKSKKNDGGLKENSRKSKNTYLKYSFNEEHKKESTAKKIDFLKDDVQEMTYGRRIALKLMKYKWYNPLCEESEEEKEEETIEEKDSVPRIVDDFYKDFNFEKPNLAKGEILKFKNLFMLDLLSILFPFFCMIQVGPFSSTKHSIDTSFLKGMKPNQRRAFLQDVSEHCSCIRTRSLKEQSPEKTMTQRDFIPS